MLSDDEIRRFTVLRNGLFAAIRKSLEEDGHCKSYEGAMRVIWSLPDYFSDDEPEYVIELDCYVIGPSRHYQWKGTTFMEALNKAELDIRSWIAVQE